jgi:hypothetical protein
MNYPSKRPAWFVLTRHWLSLVGAAMVATAVISWLFVLPHQIRGHVDNPYVGIVIFLNDPVDRTATTFWEAKRSFDYDL